MLLFISNFYECAFWCYTVTAVAYVSGKALRRLGEVPPGQEIKPNEPPFKSEKFLVSNFICGDCGYRFISPHDETECARCNQNNLTKS